MSEDAELLVLLVRHPETEANAARRYAGTSESPYTPRGHAQAAELIGALGRWGADRVFSSPRERALHVARAVAWPEEPIVTDDLAEIGFGEAELMTYEEMSAAGLGIDYPGLAPLEGLRLAGESWQEFERRIARIADGLAAGAGRTLVVAHGGVVRALIGRWLELGPMSGYRFEVANAGHALIGFSGGVARLRSFGTLVDATLP